MDNYKMQVAATMGITVEEINAGSDSFDMLQKAAEDMGKATQFSADEAAGALNNLALAGYDAEKAVDALPHVLNLAAAGGLDLENASRIATKSMNALGLETEELEGFVDEMAVTAQKSGTNVEQLGEAILAIGGSAKGMAGGTVELNAQLGILADAGFEGSRGGIALRNVLVALKNPTGEAAKQLDKMGVSAYDADGNLRPTNETLQDLNDKMEGLSQAEKDDILGKIFNKNDLAAAGALIANSGERFDELSDSIANSENAASLMAETLNDNLKGDITKLGSALSGLGIDIYENLDAPLRNVSQLAIAYVDDLANAFDEGGIQGLLAQLGDIIADVATKIAEQLPGVIELGAEMIANFLQGIQENSETLMTAANDIIIALVEGIITLLPMVIETGMLLVMDLANGFADNLPMLLDAAINGINSLVDMIIDMLPLLLETGMNLLVAIAEGLVDSIPKLIESALKIVEGLVRFIIDNLPMVIETAITLIKTISETLMENIPLLISAALDIVNGLIEYILDNLPALIDMAINLMITIMETLLDNIPLLVNAGIQLVFGIIDGLINNLPALVSAAIQLITALIGGIVRMIPQIISTGLQLMGEFIVGILKILPRLPKIAIQLVKSIISGIGSGISGMVSIGADLIKGLWRGIGSVKDWILGKIKGFMGSITSGIKSFFGIGSPSKLFADEVGQWLPAGISVGFEDEMPTLEKDMDSELDDLTKGMTRTVDMEMNAVGTNLTTSRVNQGVGNTGTAGSDKYFNLIGDIKAIFEVEGRPFANATAPYVAERIEVLNKRKEK